MKRLLAIAQAVNAAAGPYRMGKFQKIRRKIHNLTHSNTRGIFSSQTVQGSFGFHSGGRRELQFNIGFEPPEKEWLRFGVAFSLEPSRSLPDPLILKPKIVRFNEYIRINQAELEDLLFWSYLPHREPQKSEKLPVRPISADLIQRGAFLFAGKIALRESVTPQEILFLFDRLLDAYEYVESSGALLRKRPVPLRKGLQFKPGCPPKPVRTVARSKAAQVQIDLKHNRIQATVYSILCKQHGSANVGTENDTGRGSRVDLVVRKKRKHLYYEIKTSPLIRDCLRAAVAQLLEYSYWPGGNEAERLIIVSENPVTPDARRYLKYLRQRFKLPIFYQRLDSKAETLGDFE
jgi:hypothetical protein